MDLRYEIGVPAKGMYSARMYMYTARARIYMYMCARAMITPRAFLLILLDRTADARVDSEPRT